MIPGGERRWAVGRREAGYLPGVPSGYNLPARQGSDPGAFGGCRAPQSTAQCLLGTLLAL